MNKGVFLCVGTGGHVLPAYNVIKSMLDQGIDKKNILIVTDERGIAVSYTHLTLPTSV